VKNKREIPEFDETENLDLIADNMKSLSLGTFWEMMKAVTTTGNGLNRLRKLKKRKRLDKTKSRV
jgi:hypothetical protein